MWICIIIRICNIDGIIKRPEKHISFTCPDQSKNKQKRNTLNISVTFKDIALL